ncbi:hypothetical protein ACEQ8H_001430 [Pleosporales sp. CAS-2024a]
MSWMDSWSRPAKHAATPPPLYLTVGDSVPYCHSCGRVIGERRKHGGAQVKYCSARCRNSKPGITDGKIESTFAALLNGATPESLREEEDGDGDGDDDHQDAPSGKEKTSDNAKFGKHDKKHKKKGSKTAKGDHRIIVECETVQDIVFQREKDPEKVHGRRKNRRARFVVEKPEDWRSVDMVDNDTPLPDQVDMVDNHTPLPDQVEYGYGYGSGKIRPPQHQNDVNGSVGGEKGWAERIHETDHMKAKRREGQRRADEREMVRKAARRGCAFGFAVDGDEDKKKCEAVMKGAVVEASFAKGEWGIRWRERL